MESKNIFKILCLIIICLGCMYISTGCSYAKGKFIELNFTQEDNNQPVKLNDEEILFLGGWNGNNTKKVIPAKVYNIKSKKLYSLNTTMNFPRAGYGAVKYDDNHVLVLGGYCIGENNYLTKDCSKVAEIYNIKENKFSVINNSLAKYFYAPGTIINLPSNNLLILTSDMIIKFYSENNNLKKLNTYKNKFSYLDYQAVQQDNNNILIFGRNQVLQHDKNGLPIGKEQQRSIIKYNIAKNTLEEIMTDYVRIYSATTFGTAISLDKNIIFWSGSENSGKLSMFDKENNEIKDFGKTDFGTKQSTAISLDDENILITGGCIKDSDYFAGKYLIHGVLNIKSNKIYSVKTTNKALYETFIIPINKNNIFISGYKNMKPMIYKY